MGGTDLFTALQTRDPDTVRQVLAAAPAAARAPRADGLSPLMFAIYTQFRDGIQLLLAHGALRTVHEAAALGDAAAVERLVAADRSALHAVSVDGATALHLAAHYGHVDTVRRLLALGAEPSLCTPHGFANTALHAAAAGRRSETARALIEAGAPVDARDRNGYTPLHLAAAGGADDIVRLLLAAGADPQAARAGQTALDLALERDETGTASLLADALQAAAAQPPPTDRRG